MIRPAVAADASAVARIYAPIVRSTYVSFEIEPPDADEMRNRIEESLLWLVYERSSTVHGYAYAVQFHPRPAYRWSVEVSIYLGDEARGQGVGRRLVQALIRELQVRGFVNAFAGIALPNPSSVRLFESLAFEQIALQKHVGFKLGSWHDVGWWQLEIQAPKVPPDEILSGG